MAGRPSRNEKRAASSRLRSRNSAAVNVEPERDTPGIRRPDLGKADNHRVLQADMVEAARMIAVEFGDGEQRRHHDAGDADNGQRAHGRSACVQDRLHEMADDDDRKGGQNDPGRESKRPVVEVSPAHRLDRSKDQRADVRPEIADDGGERRKLHGRGKGRSGIFPAKESGNDLHMRRGGDRQKLGDALNHSEDRDLGVAQIDEARVETVSAIRRHASFPFRFESAGRESQRRQQPCLVSNPSPRINLVAPDRQSCAGRHALDAPLAL